MDEISREEFNRLKEESSKRIREMYKGHQMPPYPDFISLPKEEKNTAQTTAPVKTPTEKTASAPFKTEQAVLPNILKSINISELLKNPESLLILGLIILLLSDKADEKLILALVFIML